MDVDFEDEFRRLIELWDAINEILDAVEQYPRLWIKAYEALKPIRSGKPIVLWQGHYQPADYSIIVYMGTGFLGRIDYWEKGKDLLVESDYACRWFTNRVEDLLGMPILTFLCSKIDLILEKCRAAIRDDLEFLLRNPPEPLKFKPVTVEAEDIALIRARRIFKFETVKLEATANFYNLRVILEDTEGQQIPWAIESTDFWNAELRAALLRLLEKTRRKWESQLPANFHENLKRLKGIIELKQLTRLLSRRKKR